MAGAATTAFYLDSLVLSPTSFPDPAALVKDCMVRRTICASGTGLSGSLYARWDAAALSYVIEGFRRRAAGAAHQIAQRRGLLPL